MRRPEGRTTSSSPTRSVPAPRRPAYQRCPSARITYCTGRRAGPSATPLAAGTDSRCSSSDSPPYHGIAVERSTTLSPCRADTGMKPTPVQAEPRRPVEHLARHGVEALLGVADEVHLVHQHGDVGHAEQRRDRQVAARLLGHPAAGVDQHEREVGGRGAGGHVARVLRVAGAVVQHEAAARGGEVAVGDVDRDALLALGAQAVGQPREVGGGAELVGHQRLGVVQQAADQRRLAVVDRARGRHPKHQV